MKIEMTADEQLALEPIELRLRLHAESSQAAHERCPGSLCRKRRLQAAVNLPWSITADEAGAARLRPYFA